jgi:hypothetical protein
MKATSPVVADGSDPGSPTLEAAGRPSHTAAGKPDGDATSIPLSETLPAPVATDHPSPELPTDDPARYRITGEHARGGLGRIVNATDLRLGRTVAIKELIEHSESLAASFVREALVTARLQHPGIVPIHDAGRWPSGEAYYSMPLLPGRSLKATIEAARTIGERLDLVRHALAVADTLAYAHSKGVVHRDVKPANIMIGEYGETVLIDWGLALIEERADSELGIVGAATNEMEELAAGFASSSSEVVGTPAYMSPEQAKGGAVDATADVYALGAVLYELLTGHAPYSGTSAKRMLELVQETLPTPAGALVPNLPPELVAIVGKAMARAPADRYPSARELASDLRRFQAGQLVAAHRYSLGALLGRWLRKNKSVVTIAAVAGVAVVTMGVLSVERVVEERNVAMQQRSVAQAAFADASQRRRELILLQAKSSLNLDPTAAIAWLKDYDPTPDEMFGVQALISEARARGVAQHVVRVPHQVFTVRYAPDGSTVAFVSADGAVHAIDLATQQMKTVGIHPGEPSTLAFDPTGARLATSTSRLGTVRIWHLATGTFTELPAIGSSIVDVAFSARGDELLVSARDQEHAFVAAVWDIDRSRQV